MAARPIRHALTLVALNIGICGALAMPTTIAVAPVIGFMPVTPRPRAWRHVSTMSVAANPPPPPPPRARLQLDQSARVQLSVLLGCGMVAQMGIGMIVPLLPMYAERIGLAASGVGLVVAMPSIARLLLNLPLGALSDAYGRKLPLVVGSIVEAIGSIGTALATSLGSLLVPRLLVGAGSSAASAAGNAMFMDVVERYPSHRGLLLGSSQAVLTLAFAAGPAVGGLLADATGNAALPFGIFGLTLLASAPLYYFLLPNERLKQATADKEQPRAAAVGDAARASLRSFGQLLTQRPQLALLAMRFGLITGWSAWLTVLPLHARACWGATAGDLGRMFSIVALLGFASAPLGGWLADRFGRTPVIAAGSAVSAISIGALPWATGKLAFYACMACWDVGEAVLTAAMSALAADVTPAEQRGAQSSLINQVQDATFVGMPVLLGAIAGAHSCSAALLTTAGVAMACNVAFALLMRPPRRV